MYVDLVQVSSKELISLFDTMSLTANQLTGASSADCGGNFHFSSLCFLHMLDTRYMLQLVYHEQTTDLLLNHFKLNTMDIMCHFLTSAQKENNPSDSVFPNVQTMNDYIFSINLTHHTF